MASTKSDEWYRKTAKKRYHSSGEIRVEFIQGRVIKETRLRAPHGAWVEAYVYVEDSDDEE